MIRFDKAQSSPILVKVQSCLCTTRILGSIVLRKFLHPCHQKLTNYLPYDVNLAPITRVNKELLIVL